MSATATLALAAVMALSLATAVVAAASAQTPAATAGAAPSSDDKADTPPVKSAGQAGAVATAGGASTSGAKAESPSAKSAAKAAHPKNPCERLDAASTPACADLFPPTPVAAPKPTASSKPPAAPAPLDRQPDSLKPDPTKPASTKPTSTNPGSPKLASAAGVAKPQGAKSVASPARQGAADYWQAAVEAVHKRPILAGGAGGGLVLLLSAGVWGAASRLRRRPRAPKAPRATPPTAFRRDIVFKDEAGRDWRSAGSGLTPGVVAGSGAESQLRLTGDDMAPRHLMIWVCDGRLLVRPLAEPVFLNDRLLKDATPEIVSTGDRVRLGRASFTIMID